MAKEELGREVKSLADEAQAIKDHGLDSLADSQAAPGEVLGNDLVDLGSDLEFVVHGGHEAEVAQGILLW